MFDCIKKNKTRCINIISEKVTKNNDRKVDTRYSSADFCSGQNNLGEIGKPRYQYKTSNGHLFVNYNHSNYPFFEIITDQNKLIKRFL